MATTREPTGSQSVLKNDPPVGEAPGPATAAGGRDLRALSPEECFGLLEEGGVGRVGFTTADGVVILPVNFAIAGKTILFRTGPDTLLAAHGNGQASFEADHVDDVRREGWSVLIQGHTHRVTGEHAVRRLERATHLEPWAGGARDVYMQITPVRISGRRIGQAGLPAG